MAETGTVTISPFRNRKQLLHESSVTLDGSGNGTQTINLTSSFTNAPTMKAHPPLGNTGEGKYVMTNPTSTSLVVTVTGETAFSSKTLEVIVYAVEPG